MATPAKTIKEYFQGGRTAAIGNLQACVEQAATPYGNVEEVPTHETGQNAHDLFAASQAYCKEIQSKLASRTLLLRGDPWVKPSPPQCRMQNGFPTIDNASFQQDVFVWSPEHLLPGFKMTCPDCKVATGSFEWVRPRTLHGLTQINYYLTCKYSCLNCGAGKPRAAGSRHKQRKTFMADARNVLDQLPPGLAAMNNFIDSGKIICEPTVLDFIRAMATKTSWSGIAEALNELKSRSLQKHLPARGAVLDPAGHQDDWGNFEIPPPYRLSDAWVRNTYVKDGHRRQVGRTAELATETGDDILMLDWTKDAAARSSGTWLFNAMDSKRRILAFKLTNTSKPKEVEDILDSLAERGVSPQVVYVDEECCGSWKEIIERIWPHCQVRLDPFHAMRRLSETTSSTQHPWHGEFCGKLSSAIYTYDHEIRRDLESARLRQNLSSHIPRQDLLKHVPKRIENPEQIIAAVSTLLAEYKSKRNDVAGPLLTADTGNAWLCLQRHISQGCLCDPKNVSLHQATGKQSLFGGEAFPILRSRRGSSALEGFHVHQKQWLGALATHGREAGSLLLEDGVTRWNRKRHREEAINEDLPTSGVDKKICQ